MTGYLDRLFRLRERNTSVRTEILAGVTTFLTMAYIVVVNPAILQPTGMPIAAVAAATCLSAFIACVLMGLLANVPIALAPGMGLNAYFTYTVVIGMHVPWQTALGCVFLSGVAFLLLTFAGIRQLIVQAIPRQLFAAVAAGIGLFLAFIGLHAAGIVVAHPATLVALGDLSAPPTMVAVLTLLLTMVLQAWRVRGAILIGILVGTAAGWAAGLIPPQRAAYDLTAMSATAFHLDVASALQIGGGIGVGLVEIFFVFLFVDLFDNVGTLVAVTKRAGLTNPDGSIPSLRRILFADSAATIVGSLAGTSTVVSYVESASGIAAGGRTGLTALVTGLLFLVALFAAPLVTAIPIAATAPALIIVGGMMLGALAEIDWNDPEIGIPAFLTLIMIPLSFSIANGLSFGITTYALLRIARGKAQRSEWLLYVLALLFVVRFVYLTAGA
ncbi:NCS2 family permease [Roseiterribacter gracilis]|uniref:Xanthine/uracil permease n=1 Tax=Roseiterribacter gracilis TaxID=2812848 RepID=A0A8S8XAE1_9PROT|nr:xanthine/uracil permease [Rhodospirillales bacterium TMPK1]